MNKHVHFLFILFLGLWTFSLYIEDKERWFEMLIFTFVTILDPSAFCVILFLAFFFILVIVIYEYPLWTAIIFSLLGKYCCKHN